MSDFSEDAVDRTQHRSAISRPDQTQESPDGVLQDMPRATDTGDATMEQRNGKCPHLLVRLRGIVTIEVILFLYVFGAALIGPTVKALVYRKVCLSKYNVTVCDNLNLPENTHQEDEVQADSSRWYLAENLCFEIPSILLSPFYGSLSDNMSRKVALLLPVTGQILSSISYVINSVNMDIPVGYILFGPTVSGIFGGRVSGGMAAFSYLSDITTEKSRTMRIAFAEGAVSLGAAISLFIGGKVLDSTSYHFVTSLALSLYVITFVYAKVWIREPPSSKRTGKLECGAIWTKVCQPEKIKETLRCVFRKRPRNRRAHILACLCVLVTGGVGTYAETLVYLFVRKQPMNWTQTLYGYFAGYATMLSVISQLLIMFILREKLRMRDTNVIILAFSSMAATMILLAFSTHTWMVFLAPLVNICGPLYGVVLRSMISKMVEKDELGRLFAVFGAIQSADGILSALIYNNLYPATLSFWPGFCFIVGAAVCSLPISLAVWLGRNLKKYGWESYDELNEDQDDKHNDGQITTSSTSNGDRHDFDILGTNGAQQLSDYTQKDTIA